MNETWESHQVSYTMMQADSYTALGPGAVPSFAVSYTEKYAFHVQFNNAKLGLGPGNKTTV